jgi:hypothetical protein
MYYQNEMLANSKVQEIEEMSREAWKFTAPKKESMFQNVIQKFLGSLDNKKSKADNSSCVTC